MKFPEFISGTHAKLMADKRILAASLAALVVLVSVGGYFGYQEMAKRWSIPQVSGANFSLEYRKIPFDVKSLDVTFSTDLDPASLNAKNISLSPFVDGKARIQGNTVSYMLDKKLTIGETYTLSVGSDIRSVYGKELGQEHIFTVEAIAGAQATKILPSGKIENLGQGMLVLFNIPMVGLTNLDARDRLPCPLEITPKIEGVCKWTNGNVLEFVPKNPLESATRYHLKVSNAPGLLYTLANVLESDVITPELAVSAQTPFDPSGGIELQLTAAVNRDDLLAHLSLAKAGEKLDVNIEPVKVDSRDSETRFIITPKNTPLLYATDYSLLVSKWLKPKYGTEPLASDYAKTLRGADFLSGSQVFRNIFNASGALADTREYTKEDPFIPTSKVFFRQTFLSEVPLNKDLFTLQTSGGKVLDFDLAYVRQKKYDEQGKEIGEEENKHLIDLTPKAPLDQGTAYSLVLRKKADPSIPADIVSTYVTPPKFEILDHAFLSNTETCIYTNTRLDTSNGPYISDYEKIKTVPVSKVHDLMLDGQMDYSTNAKTFRCAQKTGISYILGTRLEPRKDYSIVFPANFEDNYGNMLGKEVSFSVKSTDIAQEDLYLYSSLNRPIQVIPNTLPIVLSLQSINANAANLEVCEMDMNGYRDYLSAGNGPDYTPICAKETHKNVALKNRYWNITANKIDIEKDITGTPLSAPFVLVRASVGAFNMGSEWYMDNEREFLHVFVRSNLSLVLEDAKNTKILAAMSFNGKALPDNLSFEAYTMGNGRNILEPLKLSVKWNAQKKYYEVATTARPLSLLVARNDQYFGILNLANDQVSNYDFKYISGQDSQTKDYLYIYSDRPLYRAGETVFFKGLLREFRFDGYRGSAAKAGKLDVVDANGAILTEMDIVPDKNSNFSGKFVLPKDMPLGHYTFDFYAGDDLEPVYNNGEFDVSAYKNPTFKVNIAADRTDAMIGDRATISANAEYYFGGRLLWAPYTYSVLTQSYFFNARDYQGYQFWEGSEYFDCIYWGSCSYGDNLLMTWSGQFDRAGETRIVYEYPKTDDADKTVGEKIYAYTLETTDPDTKKTVTNSTSQILHTTDAYVGIRIPYWNQKKDGVKVEWVVLGYEAQGLPGKHVKLELWKREWKDIKKQGVDGTFYNESSLDEKKEAEKSVSSDSKGEFSEVFMTQWDGEYEIRALYTGTNKQTFLSSSTLYVSGDNTTYWAEGNNSVTDLIADQVMLKVGDTAAFTLKSPVSSGKMLVTVEKDDGVLDSYIRDITSTTERIEVPIKDTYVPNFYVKVFLLGQDTDMKLPVYRRALAVMKVTTDPKKLSVTLTPEKKQYLPGDRVKISVTVKDSAGHPVAANGSISLVDESLLALAGNPPKNPFAFFYDMKRYLGIETYVSLVNLIEKLEVKDTSLGEKWGAGDGQKGGSSRKKRGVFKDTAFWQADFTTDGKGVATITTEPLPDNLTTWVAEAIVSTTLGNRVGIATEKIMTTKTVVVNENLPRFLGSDDVLVLSPVVFNKTGKDQSFDVTATAVNTKFEDGKRTVFIRNGESVTVTFDATVASMPPGNANDPFAAKITFKAVAKDSGELDEVENTIPIHATTTSETVATAGKTDSSTDERIALSDSIRKNGGSVQVSYAASLLPNILSGIDYLRTFPYGCSEQRTSAIMPTVYLKQLHDSMKVPFDLKTKTVKEYIDPYQGYQERSLDTVIRGYLVEIRNLQRLDGGFAYWTDSEVSDFPLSIEILSALSEIRSIGYSPNDTMVENAVKYIKARFYENKRPYCFDKSCEWDVSTRLSAIESILDYQGQDYEAYKMYKLLPTTTPMDGGDSLTNVNRIRVLAKLQRINAITKGEKDALAKTANELVTSVVSNRLVYNPRGAFLSSAGGGSRLTTTARFMEALSLMGQASMKEYAQITDQMQRWIISEKRNDGSFGSTAETSEVIRALAHSMRVRGELVDVNMQAKLSLDSVLLTQKAIDQNDKLETFSQVLGLDTLKDNSILHFEKTGQGNLYYDIAVNYQIPAKDVAARDEGFFLEQSSYDYMEYQVVKKAKEEEWLNYMSGSIGYKDLKYPKEIVTYLTPITQFTVGKLVYVHNRLITGESRDQVAFEGFIPSGAELVNPDLGTENKQNRLESIFEHEEWQNDRYFGTVTSLEAGAYEFGYIVRPTHAGSYQLLSSRAFEFYHPEVFGRTSGKVMKIVGVE